MIYHLLSVWNTTSIIIYLMFLFLHCLTTVTYMTRDSEAMEDVDYYIYTVSTWYNISHYRFDKLIWIHIRRKLVITIFTYKYHLMLNNRSQSIYLYTHTYICIYVCVCVCVCVCVRAYIIPNKCRPNNFL